MMIILLLLVFMHLPFMISTPLLNSATTITDNRYLGYLKQVCTKPNDFFIESNLYIYIYIQIVDIYPQGLDTGVSTGKINGWLCGLGKSEGEIEKRRNEAVVVNGVVKETFIFYKIYIAL